MKLGAVLIISALSMPVSGGTQLAPQTIVNISTGWSQEGIYLNTEEQLTGEECTGTSAVIQNSNPYFNQLLSISLSAFHAGKKVQFYVSGCTSNNHMALQAIKIND